MGDDAKEKRVEQNLIVCSGKSEAKVTNNKQELSYRKQIAHQLRTQFVEGISVTVKGHLRSLETEPLDRSYTTYY